MTISRDKKPGAENTSVRPGQIDPDRAADAAPGPFTDDQNKLLDEALEATFPGRDPISPKRIT